MQILMLQEQFQELVLIQPVCLPWKFHLVLAKCMWTHISYKTFVQEINQHSDNIDSVLSSLLIFL